MPANVFTERAADQRRKERANVDSDVEDRVGAVPARIVGCIKAADLRRNIGLESPVAQNEQQEGEQKKMLEGHHEMACDHQHRAKDDGWGPANPSVGENSAEYRRQIDQAGVEPINLRCQRLDAKRSGYRFEPPLQGREAQYVSGDFRLQQIVDHVQNEQRPHSVIRKALPHLGCEQKRQAFWMAKQLIAALAGAHRVARCCISPSYDTLPFGELAAIEIAVRSGAFPAYSIQLVRRSLSLVADSRDRSHALRAASGFVRWRIDFQEGGSGLVDMPRDLARAWPVDDAKQQVHHQVAPQ